MHRSALACCAFLCAALLASRSRGIEPVSIAAGADKDYVAQKFGERGAKAKPETYVLAQGSFFDGGKTDGSLDRMPFAEVARELAPGLAVQSYFPSRDAKSAELLIVVHWGMTAVEDDATNGQADMDRLMADLATCNSGLQKSSIADPGFVNSDLDVMETKSAKAGTNVAENAQLIGFLGEFRKEEYRSAAYPSSMSEEDRQLRDDLGSERYFFILMAYDFNSIREGRIHGTKPRLLWSSHVSISAIGQNFTAALPAMGRIAAGYYGHQVDGLLLDVRNVPSGDVEIGIPRTVEDRKTD